MNSVIKTIYERRAVRKYKSRTVDKLLINQIIEAGKMAPSAINKQPWSFYVLTDKDEIRSFSKQIARASVKIMVKKGVKAIIKSAAGLLHAATSIDFFQSDDFVFHGAPVVIFITAPKDNEWASLDIGMCSQNMMLAAKSLGIDSCPVGFGKFVEETKSFSKLRVPQGEQVMLSIIFGYGEETPEVHERRKDNVFFIN